MPNKLKPYLFSCFGMLLLCRFAAVAVGQVDENIMKAVAFEQISRFVEWPDKSPASDNSGPFIIGIFGRNPVSRNAEALYAEQPIKDKRVEIRYLSNREDAAHCHLIYIADLKEYSVSAVLAVTEKRPILTICDSPGVGEKGILVNLYVAENKLRFEINEIGFRKAGLQVAPILLKVARIVGPVENFQ
jgi:hypothetical protein